MYVQVLEGQKKLEQRQDKFEEVLLDLQAKVARHLLVVPTPRMEGKESESSLVPYRYDFV